MADTKISNLTAASALTGTEKIPLSDGTATTKAATATQIKMFANTAPVFAAGTASASTAPKLTSGTLNTTPEAGAIEFLTGIPYLSPIDSNRAVLACAHFVSIANDVTGTNGTAVQSIFAAANDRLTVAASTTYLFELMFQVTAGATTTTVALAFDAGTCTYTAIRYVALSAVNVADNATGTAQSTMCVNTAAVTVINATGTGAGKWCYAKGMMRINGAGTMVPQFKYSADPTGTVLIKAGSYMTLTPIGSNTVVSVGNWS